MEDGEAFFGEFIGFFVAVAFGGVGFGAEEGDAWGSGHELF